MWCSYRSSLIGSTLFTSMLKFVSNVRKLFAADDFSRCQFSDAFFLGALRVKKRASNKFPQTLKKLVISYAEIFQICCLITERTAPFFLLVRIKWKENGISSPQPGKSSLPSCMSLVPCVHLTYKSLYHVNGLPQT